MTTVLCGECDAMASNIGSLGSVEAILNIIRRHAIDADGSGETKEEQTFDREEKNNTDERDRLPNIMREAEKKSNQSRQGR